MNTLSGHFIRYISPVAGQPIKMLVNTLLFCFHRDVSAGLGCCVDAGFTSSPNSLHILIVEHNLSFLIKIVQKTFKILIYICCVVVVVFLSHSSFN